MAQTGQGVICSEWNCDYLWRNRTLYWLKGNELTFR